MTVYRQLYDYIAYCKESVVVIDFKNAIPELHRPENGGLSQHELNMAVRKYYENENSSGRPPPKYDCAVQDCYNALKAPVLKIRAAIKLVPDELKPPPRPPPSDKKINVISN